MTHYDDMITCG